MVNLKLVYLESGQVTCQVIRGQNVIDTLTGDNIRDVRIHTTSMLLSLLKMGLIRESEYTSLNRILYSE